MARSRVVTMLFVGVLTATLIATPFLPPPDGPTGFAVLALVSYAVLAAIASWVDHRRSVVSSAS